MEHLSQAWPLRAGRRNWLIAGFVLVAVLGVLALLDVEVMHLASTLPQGMVTVFGWITRLGESDYVLLPTLLGFAVAGLAAALVKSPVAKAGLRQLAGVSGFVFVAVGLPGLVTAIAKRFVGRPRPDILDDQIGAFDLQAFRWLDWTYHSFPSGHATTSFALCFAVAFLFPRAYPWMLALAALVAVSRIAIGVHYPTDLVAGAAIGMLGAYLVRNFFAARAWLFQRDENGKVVRLPFDAIRAMFGRG